MSNNDKESRLRAVAYARSALTYTNDWRAVYAAQIAERFAHGMASFEQLNDAWHKAADAARGFTGAHTANAVVRNAARIDASEALRTAARDAASLALL